MYYNLPKLSLYWYQVALHPRSTHNHPILLATCLTYFYLLGKFSTPPLRQTLYKKDIIFPRHLYAVNVLLKIFLSILTIFNRKFKIRKLWISATKYCHFLYRDHFHPKSYERYTFIYIYFCLVAPIQLVRRYSALPPPGKSTLLVLHHSSPALATGHPPLRCQRG